MPPAMMADLEIGVSTNEENAMATSSPYNMHHALILAINNPSRTMQPPGGLSYIPQVTPIINTVSLMSIGQQMDRSNHEMLTC